MKYQDKTLDVKNILLKIYTHPYPKREGGWAMERWLLCTERPVVLTGGNQSWQTMYWKEEEGLLETELIKG